MYLHFGTRKSCWSGVGISKWWDCCVFRVDASQNLGSFGRIQITWNSQCTSKNWYSFLCSLSFSFIHLFILSVSICFVLFFDLLIVIVSFILLVTSLALDGTQTRLFSGSLDQMIKIYDTTSYQVLFVFLHLFSLDVYFFIEFLFLQILLQCTHSIKYSAPILCIGVSVWCVQDHVFLTFSRLSIFLSFFGLLFVAQ